MKKELEIYVIGDTIEMDSKLKSIGIGLLFFLLWSVITPSLFAASKSPDSNLFQNLYCSFFWKKDTSCLPTSSNSPSTTIKNVEETNGIAFMKLQPLFLQLLGERGPQGEKGDKGDSGTRGEKGEKGDTGSKGDKGDTGSTGSTGSTGATGSAGAKGDKGDSGVGSTVAYSAGNGLLLSGTTFSIKLNGTSLSVDTNGLQINTIGSSQITDGTIIDSDISSSAGITWSKISKTSGSVTDLDVPTFTGNQNKYLRVNATGDGLSWETATAADFETTVGSAGSGADYTVDHTSDEVQIQAAINAVATAGGGVVRILAGVYDIRSEIVIPKDPKIKIEGEYVAKFGYGGTELRANSGLVTNLEAIIKEAGNANADTSNADHSHASQYSKLIFNGNDKADVDLLLYNTDHTLVSDCKFVGAPIALDGQYNGVVAQSDYAGGLRVERSSFLASNINIRLNSHTQDWITDSWFLGHPETHIQFIKSNKIHLSNNEFNQVSGQVFIFDDDATGNDATLATGSINITGGFMDAGTGKNFWVDNRTNSSSKGIIVAGVRFGTGTKTKFFNQAKEYQANTYTASNVVSGSLNPDFNDDVILINAASGTIPLKLPLASTSIKNVFIKVISLTNPVTVYTTSADYIENAGALGASFPFSEANESVMFTPDADKWRVLANYKPSGGTSSSGTNDSVTEVGSTSVTMTTAQDVLLVNASANAVGITLPTKASKYAAARKSLVIKVINAANAVTITGAGSDQIDNVGQTSLTIADTRSVTFIANSGARWRSYSSAVIGGSSGQIQFNNSGSFSGSSGLVWDGTNSRLGIGITAPLSKLHLNGSLGLKRTAVATNVNSGDEVILGVSDTSATRTVQLRTADMVGGRIYVVKDETGAASSNNITVSTEGTEKIDGQDTYVISTNYGAVTLYSNGANWFIISTK